MPTGPTAAPDRVAVALPWDTAAVEDTASGPGTVLGLVGVYDADGTLRGEVSYWIGARLGRTHCSLCEITHGRFTERSDWRAARAGLPVPFETFHRDDQPDAVRACAGGRAPVVVARTDRGPVLLLGPADLDTCGGSPDTLLEQVRRAADRTGLRWPPGPGA